MKIVQLFNLLFGILCIGVQYYEYRVEVLFVRSQFFYQNICDVVICIGLFIDNLVIVFVVGDKAYVIVILDFIYFSLCFFQCVDFNRRFDQVIQVEGQIVFESLEEVYFFDCIKEGCCDCKVSLFNDVINDLFQVFFCQQYIDKRYVFGYVLVKYNLFGSCINKFIG